jgi:putative flavoprotein involved in K+ transport
VARPARLNGTVTTVVIGAGQAGLAVSRELGLRGVDHVVLEGDSVASAWRDRWDSFSLVTPNWTLDLPGSPYDGDDPEGHVVRDEIVNYLDSYARRFAGPIHTGVRVTRLAWHPLGFELDTSEGPLLGDKVVVCTGAFQRPHRPAFSGHFPAGIAVLDGSGYRRPSELPDGGVLIVGSGQTGLQLAEELHLDGREVTVACGRAPWIPRRLGDLDTVTWINRTSFLDQAVATLPPGARLVANFQATGRDGGHDLHYRVLQDMGITLTGRLTGVEGHLARFADDLADSVAFGDARYDDLRKLLLAEVPEAPELPEPEPFRATPPTSLDLRGVSTVIFTTGYRPDYRWVQFPVFDDVGYPRVDAELRTRVPRLFFCGVHGLRVRRSGLLFGVGQDAAIVARSVAP